MSLSWSIIETLEKWWQFQQEWGSKWSCVLSSNSQTFILAYAFKSPCVHQGLEWCPFLLSLSKCDSVFSIQRLTFCFFPWFLHSAPPCLFLSHYLILICKPSDSLLILQKRILKICFTMYICVYVCESSFRVCGGAHRVRRGCSSPWSWSDRQFWAVWWVLGFELRSFGRAASGLKH